MIQAKVTHCPYCDSRELIKSGVRRNTTRTLQLYRCTNCWRHFTPLSGIKTKYSPEIIARALLTYYAGNSEEEVAALLRRKHRLSIPRRTIGRWISKYKDVCSFAPLRQRALERTGGREGLITQFSLEHRQVYVFKKHEGKLALLAPSLATGSGQRLQAYLQEVTQPSFPHGLFRDPALAAAGSGSEGTAPALSSTPQLRSSQASFETLPFLTAARQNSANDLATFGLFLAKRTVERHPVIEDFMLQCDGATVAVEVPLYLTDEEAAYYRRIGFHLPLGTLKRPITGHIDVLQVRRGLIHILDYKPDAAKINPANQLLLYALALASRTRLPLKLFVCAWFDERDYFEFYPLHAVHRRRLERGPALLLVPAVKARSVA